MATFGQGINPQLGAIDYSPILRGSLAGAEMSARGSQMIGQGLANLGQEVGKGVESYFKKQDEMKMQLGEIQAIVTSDPDALKNLPAGFLEDAKAGKLKPAVVQAGFSGVMMGQKMKDRAFQTFQQDQAKREILEQDRIKKALPELLKTSGKVPVGAMEFLRRGMESGIPVTILAPIANQLTEQSKVDAAASAPAKPGKVIDPFAIRSTDATGNPIDIIVDRFTGQEISRGPIATPPRPILTPDEQVDVAQRTAEVQGAAASANKTLDGLSVSALSADTELTKYSEIENLLNQNVETGFAQDYLTATRSLGQRAGFNDKDLANQQKLEALLSEDALLQTRNFLQGQGAVSDAERARIDKAALNSKKDKNALRELLGYRKAAAVRALAAQELRITLEDSGMGGTKIVRELNKWYRDNPFSAFVPAGGSHDFSAGNAVLNK